MENKFIHQDISRSQQRILISLCLIVLVMAVFWSVQEYDFVYFDDQAYVTGNHHVKVGLTWKNLKWAMTTTEGGFYHPLTWISFLVDFELYRFNPGGYHWTNLLLHLASTVLLFCCISIMTGSLWRSAFVAALFSLHPLHVEPVAWIAGRKDVLAGFFWIFAMMAYFKYTNRRCVRHYLSLTALYIMALMSKSMAMTLPFVLLLLDYWPLGRYGTNINFFSAQGRALKMLVWEKIPLMLIGLFWGSLTIAAEKEIGALKSIELISLDSRFANSILSYATYLWRMVYPTNLSVYYPYPLQWDSLQMILAGIFLLAVTLLAWMWHRTYPYLVFGWLWFLGTLVPVIGVVQIGLHANADRYTYIPMIGLFWALTWGGYEFLTKFNYGRWVAAFCGVVILFSISFFSFQQVHYWKNAETLFSHASSVTKDNYLVENNLGAALARSGKPAEATGHYLQALKIKPDYSSAYFNLGTILLDQGKYQNAIILYRKAIKLNPGFAEAYNNLGIAYVMLGKLEEGAFCFQAALRYNPAYDNARGNLLHTRQSNRFRPSFYKEAP